MPYYPPPSSGGTVDFSSVADALAAATTAVSFNSKNLSSVASPSASTDAATKAYVDALIPFYAAAPQEATSAAGGGTTISLASPITRVTSSGTGGVERINIPDGTYAGQVHYIYWLTDGGGDSVRVYPVTFSDGTYSAVGFRVAYGYVWTGSTWKQFLGTSIV